MADLQKLLQFDGLATAEEITGRSYKEDADTQSLGFALHMMGTQAKRKALAEAKDTHYGVTFDETVAIYMEEGFQVVHRRDFAGRTYSSDEEAPQERYWILWHPEGILATAESYQGTSLNMSKIYYNVEFPMDLANRYGYTSSGHAERALYDQGRYVWIGDHDVREGLRHTLSRLREVGTFQPKWVERPWLWLLAYSDDSDNHRAFNESVIAQLPEPIRAAITPSN